MKSFFWKMIVAAVLISAGAPQGRAEEKCAYCAAWLKPHAPFKLYGNSYYVGTAGLSAILITSPAGHILIDGTLPDAAPQLVSNISTLGFRIEDVKIILNTHIHFDHAGGIAELQKLSGAAVWASPASAKDLAAGTVGADDPQFGSRGSAPVHDVKLLQDGQALKVGAVAVTPRFTPGHTPGGTTWTWVSCAEGRCLNMVYADSLNAVSGPNFRFSDLAAHPSALGDFRRSLVVMELINCDILVSVHPEQSELWQRLERREKGDKDALMDLNACRRYAQNARAALVLKLQKEQEN